MDASYIVEDVGMQSRERGIRRRIGVPASESMQSKRAFCMFMHATITQQNKDGTNLRLQNRAIAIQAGAGARGSLAGSGDVGEARTGGGPALARYGCWKLY
jgi:hypothetical protein